MSELDQRNQEPERYTGQQTWDELQGDADEILGYDLAKDEILDALVGIPFIITQASFRPGIVRRMADGSSKTFAYVSLECLTAPEQELRIPKINVARRSAKLEPITSLDDLPFGANEHVVFNDGSTGIYRQMVQYLASKGYIVLVREGENVVTNGKLGETTYDLPPQDWHEVKAGHLQFDLDGNGVYTVHLRLKCPRGLRLSKYQNEYNPDGSQTRYLA